MMKKAIVIIFPEEEFLGTRKRCIPLFNECIKKRYLENKFELVVVGYKGVRSGVVTIEPDRVIDADITSDEALFLRPNFENLASMLCLKEYEQIVVGGFHIEDCVQKFAKAVFELNQNTTIDSDLTDNFHNVSVYQNNFDISKFNPNQQIERYLRFVGRIKSSMINDAISKFKHPVWGISSRELKALEDGVNESGEENGK